MIYTHELNRGGRGVRSPWATEVYALTLGIRYYFLTLPECSLQAGGPMSKQNPRRISNSDQARR